MIEKKAFGRTGHQSARTLFGAAALGNITQEKADEALELLLKYGVNHIDVARSYWDAELRLGPWMKEHRAGFFLATKTEQRTRDGAWRELEESLERMRVDAVDLWQMHILIDPEQWETAMGPGGALEAFIQARDQGVVCFLGVTGHELVAPKMHIRSLERFDFDSVLLPYSYLLAKNPTYAADFEALLTLCQSRNVAVQTIKSLCRRPWPEGVARNRTTWYQPLEDQAAIAQAVHWVLGDSRVFLNTSGDVALLPQILDAASRFERRPTEEEMDALVAAYDMKPLFT